MSRAAAARIRQTYRFALAFAVLVATGAPAEVRAQAGARPGGAPAALVFGIVGPETGEEAVYGNSVVAGAQAAARRINAQGGISGRKLEVLHFDDRSNTDQAARIVRDLIGRRVVAILAAPTGSSTFAPFHLVNESKTLFFSIGSRRHLRASGPYVFRTAVPDEAATDDLVRFAVSDLKYTGFALVTVSNNDYSLELGSMFRRALIRHGGAIRVQADSYDTYTGGQNMAAVIGTLRKAPDSLHAVVFTGGAGEGAALAQQMRQAGMNMPIIGSEDLFSDEYLKAGDAALGTLVCATFSPDVQSARAKEFLRDIGQSRPDRFAALAYDTSMLIAESIRTAGSSEGSRIRQALINRRDFEGATGKTGFTPENVPLKRPLIYTVAKNARGEAAFVLKADPSRGSSAAPSRSSTKP